MMKKWFLLCMIVPFWAYSQKDAGMQFEHLNNWKEVIAKAKAENKYIFLDAYTTWCGPCKYMSANIFPQPQVGTFYNANFVNVKIQLDTTKEDDEYVKKWYQDGHDIAKLYKITGYPTYLFFNPNGELVHRAIGSADATWFIAKGKEAITEEQQYYTQLRRFEKGDRSPLFLRTLANLAKGAYDKESSKKVSEAYIASQTNLFTKENLEFLLEHMEKPSDKGFEIFLKSTAKVNAILGVGKGEQKLMGIILTEEVLPELLRKNTPKGGSPDFEPLAKKITVKYPSLAKEIMAKAKVVYYQEKMDWKQLVPAMYDYVQQYGATMNENSLAGFARVVFTFSSDLKYLNEALNWSKRSIAKNPNSMLYDTYANILYKLGRTAEAIEWEEKAIQLLGKGSDNKFSQATLEKMKKGEKTWVE